MDRDITKEVRTRRTVRRVATVVVAVAAAAFCLAATVEWLRPSLDRDDVQFARVERGSVEATLQASGTIVPLVEQVVSSPVEARVLRVGRRAGANVRRGDELLTLDTAATRLEVERLGDRVSTEESETEQLRIRLDENIETLRSQLEQKKLDGEIVHYTATQKAKLRAEGLTADADALAAQAVARKTDIELRQLHDALRRAELSRAAQLAAARNKLSTAMRDREESRRQLDLAMLRADHDGVLTWVVPEVGATVRRGDVVARIADLSAYRVTATISDVHASRIAAGMRAWVKLDGETLPGVVDSVDPRIESGVMKFSVTLDQPSHARLRNNLRADVLVVTGRRSGTLVVRRGALGRTNNSNAFVLRGDTLVRVPVRFGLGGDDTIEIAEGLREGDQVAISDMTDYQDVEKVRIK
ncbi:MAG TPA: HlyD family efflux transporter periplasmic adaptor subunit [Thermoanaerobaculia bacterium]|jgi:HlyD family secretion protein|nr:HlyD family efflux transporter periplasmic adaptor subunit [Thermoanaerobaculia bacterium]